MTENRKGGFDPVAEGLHSEARPHLQRSADQDDAIHVTGWQIQRQGKIVFALVPKGKTLAVGDQIRIGDADQTLTIRGISAPGQTGNTVTGRAVAKFSAPDEHPIGQIGAHIEKIS